jgi:hypothetical protein
MTWFPRLDTSQQIAIGYRFRVAAMPCPGIGPWALYRRKTICGGFTGCSPQTAVSICALMPLRFVLLNFKGEPMAGLHACSTQEHPQGPDNLSLSADHIVDIRLIDMDANQCADRIRQGLDANPLGGID